MKLRVLCPQEYEGTMNATPCERCSTGWNATMRRCTVDTGVEHLEPAAVVPQCPIQDRCQHQIQQVAPCAVRAAGLICESALVYSGMSRADAMEHPLSFNADAM